MREALAALELRRRDRRRARPRPHAAPTTCCRRRRSTRSGRRRSSPSSSPTTSSTCGAPLFEPLPGHAARARDPRRLVRALGALHRRRPGAACTPRPPRAGPRIADAFLSAMAEQPAPRAARADRPVRDARPDARLGSARAQRRCWGARPDVRHEPIPSRCSRRRLRPLGDALFDAILASPLGRRLHRRRVRRDLAAARHSRRQDQPRRSRSCSRSSSSLPTRACRRDAEFPFVLSAGERRSSHRQHDLPRSRVAEEGRRRSRCA